MLNEDRLKLALDTELEQIKMSDKLKEKIRCDIVEKTRKSSLKAAVAFIVLITLCSTTVIAGYYINSRISVNKETLPELDSMQVVKANKIEGISDEDGFTEKYYKNYNELKTDLGIGFLDSKLATENPYITIYSYTDNKNFNTVQIDNYIIGDTSNFKPIPDMENKFSFEHGKEYFSPVSLTIDIILSEEQMANGMERDFLGMYEYVESYTSAYGYKVNIVVTTSGSELDNATVDITSQKSAIFVAEGIRYVLTGSVSVDTIKSIVDTMK